jgi:Cys-rich protein (TIGR01571 family)
MGSCCLAYLAPYIIYGEISANLTSEEILGGGSAIVANIAYFPLSVPGYVVFGIGNLIGAFGTFCILLNCEHWQSLMRDVAFLGATFGVANAAPLALPIICPLHLLCRLPMRKAIRKRHNILASDYEDCMTVWFCISCALRQVRNAMPPNAPDSLSSSP